MADGVWISAPKGEFERDDRLELVQINNIPSHYREKLNHGDVAPIDETNATYMQSAKSINVNQYFKSVSVSAKTHTSSSSEVSSSSLEESTLQTPEIQSSRESTPLDTESKIGSNKMGYSTRDTSVHTSVIAALPYGKRLIPKIIDDLAAAEPNRTVFSLSSLVHGSIELRHISAMTFAQAIDRVAWWLRDQVGTPDAIQPVAYIGPRTFSSSLKEDY